MAATDDFTSNNTTTGTGQPLGDATGRFQTASDSNRFRVQLDAWNDYTSTLRELAVGFSSASPTLTDNEGDTRETAKAILAGQTVNGSFESSKDVDYFKVALQAGTTYMMENKWHPHNVNIASFEYTATLLDANGAKVPMTYDYRNNLTTFTTSKGGDYYVVASTYQGSRSNYTLVLNPVADDYSARATGAGILPLNTSVSGKIEVGGDRDWFAASLTAATTYWFTLAGSNDMESYRGNAEFKLIGEDGATLATMPMYSYLSSGSTLVLAYQPEKSGTYHLEVSGQDHATGRYSVKATVGEPDDFGNDWDHATQVLAPWELAGKLEIPRDEDTFKVAVTAGQTYQLELTGANTAAGADVRLSYAMPSGMGSDHLNPFKKAGVTDYYTYNAPVSGTLYLLVNNPYSTGATTYTLKVSQPAEDDYAASIATTGKLLVDGSLHGTINYAGDTDWIKVTLQYGVRYAFTLAGSGAAPLTVADTAARLELTGYPGRRAYLDDVGNGIYILTAKTDGDYYIAIAPGTNYAGAGATGNYTVTAMSQTGDVTAPAIATFSAARDAGPNDKLTVTFNEAVAMDRVGATLYDNTGKEIEHFEPGFKSWKIAVTSNSITVDPTLPLRPGTSYKLALSASNIVDLAGNTYAGSKEFYFSTAPAVTAGTSGNDYLAASGNGLALNGREGIDTAVFNDVRNTYSVSVGNDNVKVASTLGSATAASDVLTSVERLWFNDISIAVDIDGNGGQAYRLYQAAFNRTPDSAGLGYWIAQMDKGANLREVAQSFIASTEFTPLYGKSVADSVFIEQLYKNVLHRAGESAGISYWTDVLVKGESRANVLASFSEGAENQAAVAKVIGNGFEYTPYG